MGYFLTFLFILVAYVTPPILLGPISDVHAETILAILAVLVSLTKLRSSGVLRTPQTVALVGLGVAIVIAVVSSRWYGAVPAQLYNYTQQAIVFYLVAINCTKKWHLQGIIVLLFLASVFFMTEGLIDLRHDVSMSPYIFGEGELRRIRGLGFVNDPNDFSQVLVSIIPAFFFLRGKGMALNVLIIGIPCAVLLVGMYFTHSRGASLALMAIILISARRKIGTVPAAILAGGLFVVVLAVGWSGGRDVSMEGGADRLDLWYGGLQLIKAHPLFGVGPGGFTDAFGITAHNSVVICAAETGIVGLFFWVLLLFSTFRAGVAIDKTGPAEATLNQGGPHQEEPSRGQFPTRDGLASMHIETPSGDGFQQSITAPNVVDMPSESYTVDVPHDLLSHDEIRGMATALFTSLVGFLTAGWFLSRSFSMWLFMYCGMMVAIWRMGLQNGLTLKRDTYRYLLTRSAMLAAMLLVVISLILRFRAI